MTNLTTEVAFDDFFALFEQPVQFALSQDSLDKHLRLLQKRYHPDNVSKQNTDPRQAKQRSEQISAIINQAYQTLSHPDSRAAYLLEKSDHAQTLEHSIADLDFLEDAMQMRMDLDEGIEAKNTSALKQLHPQVTKRLVEQSDRFQHAYQSKDWQSAIDATQKLKFLVKLDADISASLDEMANDAHVDDDDLYV